MSDQIDNDGELYVPFQPGWQPPKVHQQAETLQELEKRLVGQIAKAFEVPMYILCRSPPEILTELEARTDGTKIYTVRNAKYDTRIVTHPNALTTVMDGYIFN